MHSVSRDTHGAKDPSRAPSGAVVHVLAPAPFGGLERVVQMLTRGQAAAGREVYVVPILDADAAATHPFPDAVGGAGIQIHPLPVEPRAYREERQRVGALLRTLEPAVVHLHGYRADVLHSGVARQVGVPCVSTVHGFTGGGLKNRFYEWLQRRAFRRMEAVVAVSRKLADELAADRVPADRLHCIPNAWASTDTPADRDRARRELSVPSEGFHVGFVGRLTAEKGADVLVDAMAHLTELPIEVWIVGEGRERPALEQQAGDLDVGERVHLLGLVPEAGRWLRAFDVVVLSSRTEGTPIVLFEAMEAEVPVVAAAVGGVPDVVTDREALLVPPERPAELAAAIRAVHENPAAARARTERARARLHAEFGLERWVHRYDDVYAAALAVAAG